MRFAIPFALILALFCGCGGSTPAPAAAVQSAVSDRSASAQEESLLEDCIGPNIVDLDEIQDLLRDLFGEHDLDDIRGDDRPGDDRPYLPSLDDLNLPEYSLEGPDLDLLRGSATWTLKVNIDEDRELEPLLKFTVRFEDERGNPVIPFSLTDPPEDLEEALEGIPDGTTLVIDWEFLDLVDARGHYSLTFNRGTITGISGTGSVGDDVCVLSFELTGLSLDDFMSEHPMFEAEFELETPNGKIVGTVNFIDDDVAVITYTIDDGPLTTKYLDLETGEVSDRPPADDDGRGDGGGRGGDGGDRPGDDRPDR